ncbi:MAG: alpha-L-fucosidase, partial [Proteobacteria bacterium]|nr:alpha-L-fucosidase [Pseudomonadota bacterium]
MVLLAGSCLVATACAPAPQVAHAGRTAAARSSEGDPGPAASSPEHEPSASAPEANRSAVLPAGRFAAGSSVPEASETPAVAEAGVEAPEVGPDAASLAWWRKARFGMFIHWGLYSILAGEWGGKTDYGEWIRESARIPRERYHRLLKRFRPRKFNAKRWVRVARDAGMKYIVITTKHHDGFALFDSDTGEFDLGATPEKRDLLGELASATRNAGLRIGFYHSIMDWDHPDYLPKRPWEQRDASQARFGRYYQYMKGQLRELLTRYGDISILWFDGQWDDTWSHAYGKDLYAFVRGLQPRILINNRVDIGRRPDGLTEKGDYRGDFGTPEQAIPQAAETTQPWETCTTIGRHWGYNRRETKRKSVAKLLQILADTSSKGG